MRRHPVGYWWHLIKRPLWQIQFNLLDTVYYVTLHKWTLLQRCALATYNVAVDIG